MIGVKCLPDGTVFNLEKENPEKCPYQFESIPNEPIVEDGFLNILKVVNGALVYEKVEKKTISEPESKVTVEDVQKENEALQVQIEGLQTAITELTMMMATPQ